MSTDFRQAKQDDAEDREICEYNIPRYRSDLEQCVKENRPCQEPLDPQALPSDQRIEQLQRERVKAEQEWNKLNHSWRKAKALDEASIHVKAILPEYTHPIERTNDIDALVYRIRNEKKLLDTPCGATKIHRESKPERWISRDNEVLIEETVFATKAASINQLLLDLKTPKTLPPSQSNHVQQLPKRQLVESGPSGSTPKKASFNKLSPLHKAPKQGLDGLRAPNSVHEDRHIEARGESINSHIRKNQEADFEEEPTVSCSRRSYTAESSFGPSN